MTQHETRLTQHFFEGQPAFFIRPPLSEREATGLGKVMLEAWGSQNAAPQIHHDADATVLQIHESALKHERNIFEDVLMHLLMQRGPVTTKNERPVDPYAQ